MSDIATVGLVSLPLLALLVYMIVDVARRRDLRVTRRILWIVILLAVPIVGLGLYVVVRPPRSLQISGEGGDVATAEQIVVLAEERQRGELSDDDYHERVGAIASRE